MGAGGLCLGLGMQASPFLVLDALLGSQPQHPWLQDMRSTILPPPSSPAPEAWGVGWRGRWTTPEQMNL